MGYEPRLLIELEDLKKHHLQILNDSFSDKFEESGEDGISVPAYCLRYIERYTPFIFKGKKYVLMHPEFSSYNEEVRKYLTKLGIEYGEYN